jgi:hypothetical protein
VGWICHRVPFHRSTKVPALDPPTATHADADVHATASRKPPPDAGLGVAWICHRLPFHRSAKVPAFENPTATHADADVHATPVRKPPPDAGLGVASIVHLVPFHRSANGTDTPALPTPWPTAVHAEGNEHDTPKSALRLIPTGLGVGWTVHVVPSQRSARVTTTPECLVKSPTAVQEDVLEQETPRSWPVRPTIFPVETIDHPDPEVAPDGADNMRGSVPRTVPFGAIGAARRSK